MEGTPGTPGGNRICHSGAGPGFRSGVGGGGCKPLAGEVGGGVWKTNVKNTTGKSLFVSGGGGGGAAVQLREKDT